MRQLNFLEDFTEILKEVEMLKKTQENVRRGLFRRIGELQKEIKDLKSELTALKGPTRKHTDDLFEHCGLLVVNH
jgi:uncharacterized small protein (DUF1192 family)